MPPRRDPYQQLDMLQREFQRLRADLDGRPRQPTPVANASDPEDEPEDDNLHHSASSGYERRPAPRYGRAYQRRDPGEHDRPPRDYGVKVEIPSFEKRAKRRNISTLVPARKCPKCHGFGHWASECTTETHIVFTPDGRVIEVEEEKELISDEDPFEELKEPIWDEYPCEEPQYNVEEVSWSPPEIESSEVIWDDVPCMIMSPEPSETGLQLLPCEIPQPQELLAASEQPHQTVNVVTKEVLQQLHSHDLSEDLFEVETIEMILPPDPVKSEVHLLLGHSSRIPLEYKFLPNIVIPKVDLAWVRMKSKKVSMSSASKLGPVQMLLHSFVDTPSRMMETPPPARENDRDGLVTVAVCYSNHRYCSKPLQ